MGEYKTTVGIEVHAELKTQTKMFCGCPNDPHNAKPNQNICPVCLAHPGTLPVVNKQAVESVLVVGTAIGATLADFSEFDRKNYFYPDIPKAYQISQYAYPLVTGGEVAGVAITRIHLEEDTARSQHSGDTSLVDFNRAGVPLMELVTEPVIHDAVTAGTFARELQLLLRTLGVSDANMEKGEMRVEANISVSKSVTLGMKVEVKNLNSIRAMEQAIEYETARQIALLEAGGTVVQETRGWDEEKLETFVQRIKETADDYRYFPDPDIPKLQRTNIAEFDNSRLAEKVPKLATEWRGELRDLGLSTDAIERLLYTDGALRFFALVYEALDSKPQVVLAANYVLSDLVSLPDFSLSEASSAQASVFVELIAMLDTGQIGSRVAKDLLPEVLENSVSPLQLATERNLLQINDTTALAAIVTEILESNPSVVGEYQAGKESALQFFVGQVMKATRGSANPEVVKTLLLETLAKK